MSLVVNYNNAAFNAHRNLASTSKSLQGSIQRLSSGMRVNSAADDPSGLVISEQMRSQGDGIGQAVRNANDGINLVKTGEGALNEVHNLLRQMRTLSLHAANSGANSTEAVAADQAALDKAVEAIDRISSTTKFNGKSLLDGSFTGQTFQVGANSSDTVSLDIAATDTGTLAVDALDLSGDAAGAIDAIDAAINTISGTRSELGSFQRNTLETTVNSLTIAQENMRASESTIRDADVAAEMVQFTRNNIMLQAGTSMLAQANQAPQQVLSLIR
jgi:flagellin